MKVTPVASPHNISAPITGASTQSSAVARERAIAAISNSNPVPVDANNVSPEEIKAVTAPTLTPEQVLTPTEVDKVETQVEKKPEQDPALIQHYNKLARQERALRQRAQQQEQAFKAREAAIAAKETELTAKDNTYRTDYVPKSRLKQDALGTLEAEGLSSYDEITQRAMTRQPVDPVVQATINKQDARIAQLEAALEQNQQKAQEQQSAQYQAAVKQITQDAKDLVKSDPEFEAIRATGTVRDVVDLITKYHAKTGRILSVEEAAKRVEAEIVEEATKLTRIEKIKQRINPTNASQDSSKTAAPQQPQMKTLTNAQSSTRKLNSRERAMLAFKGELKG